MTLISPYTPSQIREILYEQVDESPPFWRCLLSFNAHFYKGTSRVCGKIRDNEFELRNRKDPYYSLRARGTLEECNSGAQIELSFLKPTLPNFIKLFFNGYKYDEKVILDFLKDWIKTKNIAEQQL